MKAASIEQIISQIDAAIQEGLLTRREARETLEGARASYRANNFERAIDKVKERRRANYKRTA
jgi:hypothetical protein